jgi:beta-N-acetylhexosaminidase
MQQPGSVMVDLKSTTIDAEEREMLTHPACGGVILFSRNIETPEQVLDLNRQIMAINPCLLLAVDQEGGRVQRLKQGFTQLPPLRYLHQKAKSLEQAQLFARHHAEVMALETLAVGFDLSFSPVLDLCTTTSRVIGDRAFHEEPDVIIALAKVYIEAMKQCGMAATGKHFPGHGSVDADSHVELPVDERSFELIEKRDLKPFAQLASEMSGVMLAHVIYPALDSLPAGFSGRWIRDILRNRLGFSGAVFTDDLSMKGAEVVGDFLDRAEAALDAGCDMVLVCNQPAKAGEVLEHLRNRMSDESSRRLMSLKAPPHRALGLSHLRSDARWQAGRSIIDGLNDITSDKEQ